MEHRLGFFERYLTLWVLLCMIIGVAAGHWLPGLAPGLNALSIEINGAPVVSVPIAVCLFFMMYPIAVKIDFTEVMRASRSTRAVLLTLFVNWAIKPFSMVLIAWLCLGVLFRGFIGAEATDLVSLPIGLDLIEGAVYGEGRVVAVDGQLLMEIPLWRSYLAGCILLGVAPCTAMVLVWGYLARGNGGLTLVMVAINSLVMLGLFGLIAGWLLGLGRLPVPWQALLLSISIYVVLPLVSGVLTRRWVVSHYGRLWFEQQFLPKLAPLTITALLFTLIALFALKGAVIVAQPMTLLWIAIPIAVQTLLMFAVAYSLGRQLHLDYTDAAPAALIGASNHFEVAIATAVMLFGLSSGAALATVVGVLIEVPLMLALVAFCQSTRDWFTPANSSA